MDKTQLFGVPSAFCLSKSTNSAMPSMPIHAPSGSIPTFLKSGLISAVSTKAAMIEYPTPSTRAPEQANLIRVIQLLKTAQATGGQFPSAPGPQDVHPAVDASAVVPPHGLTGPPFLLKSSNHQPAFRTDSRGLSHNEIALPPPQVGASRSSPGPFRGGPPPPVVLDETRHPPSHPPLASI